MYYILRVASIFLRIQSFTIGWSISTSITTSSNIVYNVDKFNYHMFTQINRLQIFSCRSWVRKSLSTLGIGICNEKFVYFEGLCPKISSVNLCGFLLLFSTFKVQIYSSMFLLVKIRLHLFGLEYIIVEVFIGVGNLSVDQVFDEIPIWDNHIVGKISTNSYYLN